jgi:hypothetical protein
LLVKFRAALEAIRSLFVLPLLLIILAVALAQI